jgi:hypothetical protein
MHTPEMYRPLVASSAIAVAVLLNVDTMDVEYVSLQPRPFPESVIRALAVEWEPRRLNLVGVLGWNEQSGIQAQLEPLPDAVAARINRGFATYLMAFSADSKVN